MEFVCIFNFKKSKMNKRAIVVWCILKWKMDLKLNSVKLQNALPQTHGFNIYSVCFFSFLFFLYFSFGFALTIHMYTEVHIVHITYNMAHKATGIFPLKTKRVPIQMHWQPHETNTHFIAVVCKKRKMWKCFVALGYINFLNRKESEWNGWKWKKIIYIWFKWRL